MAVVKRENLAGKNDIPLGSDPDNHQCCNERSIRIAININFRSLDTKHLYAKINAL